MGQVDKIKPKVYYSLRGEGLLGRNSILRNHIARYLHKFRHYEVMNLSVHLATLIQSRPIYIINIVKVVKS